MSIQDGDHKSQVSLPYFRSAVNARAGQFVPSTFPGLIAEAEEKINSGEILRPPTTLHELG